MKELAKKDCVEGNHAMSQLSAERRTALLARLPDGWQTPGGTRLRRSYAFADFAQALNWVNQIATIAEAQKHHPDLQLRWGEVVVEIWTHTVDGLTESDFVLAAKIETLRSV